MTHKENVFNMERGFIRIWWTVYKDGLVTGDGCEFLEVVQLNYEKVRSTLSIDIASRGDKKTTTTMAFDKVPYLK